MNFARDVVAARDPAAPALIEITREGEARTWTFGSIDAAAGALAGALRARGVGRSDVVLTLIGSRAEWVLALVACFRIGAIALPCNEQLRPDDLRYRVEVAAPAAAVVDTRNVDVFAAAAPGLPVLELPDPDLLAGSAPPYAELEPGDGCLITFTSGTEGRPKAVLHAQRFLTGQALQARHWLAAGPDELVWCTAASGWSKSARNAFVAPWLCGARALLHDGRFDPHERLAIAARERVTRLCMAPTEYRVIAKRAQLGPLPELRGLVAAGEPLNPEVIAVWREATGLVIRDGFGQTETGQLTGAPPDGEVRPGSMGPPLPGVRAWVEDGELVVDPRTVPTFFHGYLGAEPVSRDVPWRTGDRVREEDGWLYFEGRNDDVIGSAGYRIGPFEVESALVAHAAVAEAAVVAAPDAERGAIVRAVVVLRDGQEPSAELTRTLQEHVKATTAPYKYPRRIDYVDELPKTTSGKIQRALLRRES